VNRGVRSGSTLACANLIDVHKSVQALLNFSDSPEVDLENFARGNRPRAELFRNLGKG